MNSAHITYRLLFYALLDMRDEARRTDNKAIYHLADLFHNVALKLEKAASDEDAPIAYDEILSFIRDAAKRKGWEKWVDDRIDQISSHDAVVHTES